MQAPEPWGWRARCAQPDVDPEVFHRDAPGDAAVALALCARCLVRAECLQDALRLAKSADLGIRGGLLASERQEMPPDIQAGSGSYRWHMIGTSSDGRTINGVSDVTGRWLCSATCADDGLSWYISDPASPVAGLVDRAAALQHVQDAVAADDAAGGDDVSPA